MSLALSFQSFASPTLLSCSALTTYNEALYDRGQAMATRLVEHGLSPADIAFDADGVLQHYAIGNQNGEQQFYESLYDGGLSSGSATQYFMEIPGMADLVAGLNHPAGSPLLVTSMSVTRAVAMFNGFPRLRRAFLGDRPDDAATPERLREHPRIYCAEHLALGIHILFQISRNLPHAMRLYPAEWHAEIVQTVPALKDSWYRGKLIKNPAVIALAKRAPNFPRILIDDTRNNVQASLDYSSRAAVIRPRPPWGPRGCFFADPHSALTAHWDRQAEPVAAALESLIESMIQQRLDAEHRLIDIARQSIARFDFEAEATIVTYIDEAGTLDREHYFHTRVLKKLGE